MIYAGAYLNRKMPVFGWGTRRNHMVRKFRAEGETAFSFFPPRYIIRPKVRRPSR